MSTFPEYFEEIQKCDHQGKKCVAFCLYVDKIEA